jgi:hypothetical protein
MNNMNELKKAQLEFWSVLIAAVIAGALTLAGAFWVTANDRAKSREERWLAANAEVARHSVALHYIINEMRDGSGGADGAITQPEWKQLNQRYPIDYRQGLRSDDPLSKELAEYLYSLAAAGAIQHRAFDVGKLSRLGSLVRARIIDSSDHGVYQPSQGIEIYDKLQEMDKLIAKIDNELGIPTATP